MCWQAFRGLKSCSIGRNPKWQVEYGRCQGRSPVTTGQKFLSSRVSGRAMVIIVATARIEHKVRHS